MTESQAEICAFFFILPFCENQLKKGGDRLDNPDSAENEGPSKSPSTA